MQRLTVVVPSYNRSERLARALERLLRAREACPISSDVIVIDNNSTDDTAVVVQRLGTQVRYVFEPRQGLSYARNAGIESSGTISDGEHVIAFIDDDVEVAPDWMAVLAREISARPHIDCFGGRVLPAWTATPPRWLTRAHWAPLALQDHGEEAREFDAEHPVGLVGANVAFRATVFGRVGLFSPKVQRVKNGIGSTEDREMLFRVYASGGKARYVPDLVVTTEVPADRTTRAYHRRWHQGHGHFLAIMGNPETERTSRGRLLGVPAHLFRAALSDALSWLRFRVGGNDAEAFARETRLWFFVGFLKERAWPGHR